MSSLKQFARKPIKLAVLNPDTKEPLLSETQEQVILDVVNIENRQYADIMLELQGNIQAAVKGNTVPLADQIRIIHDTYGVYVVGWNKATEEFFAEDLGDSAVYSKENAEKVFKNPDNFWLVKQVELCVSEQLRGFQKQSKSAAKF